MSLLTWLRQQYLKASLRLFLLWVGAGLILSYGIYAYEHSVWEVRTQAWSEEALFLIESKNVKQLEAQSGSFLLLYPGSRFAVEVRGSQVLSQSVPLWSYPDGELRADQKVQEKQETFRKSLGSFEFIIQTPLLSLLFRSVVFLGVWIFVFVLGFLGALYWNRKAITQVQDEFQKINRPDAVSSWFEEINLFKESQWSLKQKEIDLFSQAELGRFYSQMAHDLKAPLGALELLKASGSLLQEEREILKMSSERIASLAQGALSERKKINLRKSVSFLRKLLENEIKNQKKEIKLNIQLEALSDLIASDQAEVFRHITNLAMNSIDALDGGLQKQSITTGDWIEIQAEKTTKKVVENKIGTEVRIRVLDSGPGVPDAVVLRLKEDLPIYTRKKKGNGLALAQAQRWLRTKGSELEFRRGAAQVDGSEVSFRVGV